MEKKLKDKKIQIMKYESIYIPGQGPEAQWVPLHEGMLWAHYRHLSGNEIFAAAQVAHIEESVFTVNWRRDIEPGQRIVYNGEQHEITRVDDYEGYKNDLRLYTKHVEGR